MNLEQRKKKITTYGLGICFKLISLFIREDISNINKNAYNEILDKVINRLDIFNRNKKIYTRIDKFDEDFWKILTIKKNFISYKIVMEILVHLGNSDYKKFIICFLKYSYKLPYILYNIYINSDSNKEIITNLALLETLIKAFQISSIMNTELNIVIKRMRLIRNIPVTDEKGNLMITRQARYPMVGSEVCPYLNYVKKCQFINVKLNYSILVIEKNIFHEFQEYLCNFHESCIVYKDKYGIINHLEKWDFWNIDGYWEIKYPNEKELLN